MPRFRSKDPWRVVWQIAISDYLLGLVLACLALALLLVAWLPQTSAGELAVDVGWQAQMQQRFGDAVWFDTIRSPLQAIGAFWATETLWFRLLLALLALALTARLIDSIEALWQGRRGCPPPKDAAWKGIDKDLETLTGRLQGRRLRVTQVGEEEEETTGPIVVADRWPWAELGPISIYLGGLVILAGVAVTALWGWRAESLYLTSGETVAVGHDSDLALQLEELSQDGGRGVAQLWRGGRNVVGAGQLAVGQPLAGGDVGVYLVGNGPGVRVRATANGTQTLTLATGPDRQGQQELVVTFTDDEESHPVGVPQADLVLLLTAPRPAEIDTLPQVQVFESGSGQHIFSQKTLTNTTLPVKGVVFDLMPAPYAELAVIHDPGGFWIQVGVVFLIIGLILRALWPPRRLWLRHRSDADDVDKLAAESEVTGDETLLPGLELTQSQPKSQASDEA